MTDRLRALVAGASSSDRRVTAAVAQRAVNRAARAGEDAELLARVMWLVYETIVDVDEAERAALEEMERSFRDDAP